MPEQFCPSCNKQTLALKEPVYDGFTRVGERLKCAACGYLFPVSKPDEAPAPAPAKRQLPSIFSEDDRPKEIKLFAGDENRRICRYCVHYIVNPFKQWCGMHRRDVEATDTCAQFTAKPDPGPAAPAGP